MDIQSLPVIQMSIVEKIAAEGQSHPNVQQQMLQQTVAAGLQDERNHVQAMEKSEENTPIRPSKKEEEQKRSPHPRKKLARGKSIPDAPDPAATDNPWAGNLLNMKV